MALLFPDQILPTGDTFAATAEDYGDSPSLYMNMLPWRIDGATGYLTAAFQGWGTLHDAYQAFPHPVVGMMGRAVFHPSEESQQTSGPGNSDWICWTLARNAATVMQDVNVAIAPNHYIAEGDPPDGHLKGYGICARVTGGTLLDPPTDSSPVNTSADDAVLYDVNGYFFVHVDKRAGQPRRLWLLKVVSGAVTSILWDHNVSLNDYDDDLLNNNVNHIGPLRMTCEDITGGTEVEIKLYKTDDRSNEILLGTVVDSSSPFTGVGRCGFGAACMHNAGSDTSAIGVDWFKIAPLSGAVVMRDIFNRWNAYAGRNKFDDEQTPVAAVTGRSLMTAWSGDGQSKTVGPGFYDTMKHDNTADAITVGIDITAQTGSPHYGWYVSSRPALETGQHRKINFKPISGEAGVVREFGVALRVGFSGTNPNFRGAVSSNRSGYMACVVYDNGASPVWLLEIRFYTGSPSNTSPAPVIVLATFDLSSAGLALGTAFDVDFEVRNFNTDANGLGGKVAMKCIVKATTAALVVNPLVSGIEVIGDWLYDYRTEAINVGFGEAFYFFADPHGTADLLEIKHWTEETLTDPPLIGINSQASVAMAGETDSKSGTLALQLSYEIETSTAFEHYRQELELGHRFLFLRWASKRRHWSVNMNKDSAERATLVTFFNDHNGSEIPFDWVHPETGEALVVHFLNDNLAHTFLRPDAERATFVLEELFA